MELIKKQRTVSSILSPDPRPLKIKLPTTRSNPFLDRSHASFASTEENPEHDLRIILESQDSPKKHFQRHKAPTRQNVNPIIHDLKFKELNSSASTEDSDC